MNITIEKKKPDSLIQGQGGLRWQRDDVLRKTGLTAAGKGNADIYYYSPTEKRIENQSQSQVNLEMMDHMQPSASTSAANNPSQVIPTMRHLIYQRSAVKKRIIIGSTTPVAALPTGGGGLITAAGNMGSMSSAAGVATGAIGGVGPYSSSSGGVQVHQFRHQFDYSRGIRTDASLVPPIRQTASIFKQPVTVYKTQESKVKSDLKNGPQEKPKQLFWEKRLEGLRACDIDDLEFGPVELPKGLKPVGPHVNEGTLLQSIATSLHVSVQPVTGQTAPKQSLTTNPGAFLNPEQPLMHAINVSEDDIRRQEERVSMARRKLQDALRV